MAKSDDLLLEFLRKQGGTAHGTLRSLSETLGTPQSTLAATLKRLEGRGIVQRGTRSISLTPSAS